MSGMHDITSDFLTCDVDGGCRITKYAGTAQIVAIPDHIGGKPVISLDGSAFNGCPVTEIWIPKSITQISTYRLFCCDQLERFKVAQGNPNYFSRDGVLYSEGQLIRFPQAHPAEEYSVPEGIRGIRGYAFSHCRGLKHIDFTEAVDYVGNCAFEACNVLHVRIPGKGDVRFNHCAFVDQPYNPFYNVGEDPDITLILPRCSQAHIWAEILGVECCFDDGFHAEEIVLSEEKNGHRCVTETGECVLTKYDGPGGTVVIPKNLDLNCYSDYVYYAEQEDPYRNFEREYKEKYGICYRDQDESIHYCVPMPARKIGDGAFAGCDTVVSVEIPDSVTGIGKNAFSGCAALGSVTVPASVAEIGQEAFSGCPNLVLAVAEGSFAHRYAIEKRIPFTVI